MVNQSHDEGEVRKPYAGWPYREAKIPDLGSQLSPPGEPRSPFGAFFPVGTVAVKPGRRNIRLLGPVGGVQVKVACVFG